MTISTLTQFVADDLLTMTMYTVYYILGEGGRPSHHHPAAGGQSLH